MSIFAAFAIKAPVHIKLANMIVASRRTYNTQHYIHCTGQAPNYIKPVSITEKMQCRKLFDRNPLFPIFCDKLLARNFAKNANCGVKLPKIYWSGDDPDKIPFAKLPVPYIIKPNHSSGAKHVVRHATDVDQVEIRKKCHQWLKKTYGVEICEWGYQNIKGKILIEEFLPGPTPMHYPDDFRIWVFSGQVEFIQNTRATYDGKKYSTYFDQDWNPLSWQKWNGYMSAGNERKDSLKSIPRPKCFDKMVEIAEVLTGDIDHVRVDLYDINGEVYFGELTAYSDSGFSFLFPDDASRGSLPPNDLNLACGSKWNQTQMATWRKLRHVLFD